MLENDRQVKLTKYFLITAARADFCLHRRKHKKPGYCVCRYVNLMHGDHEGSHMLLMQRFVKISNRSSAFEYGEN